MSPIFYVHSVPKWLRIFRGMMVVVLFVFTCTTAFILSVNLISSYGTGLVPMYLTFALTAGLGLGCVTAIHFIDKLLIRFWEQLRPRLKRAGLRDFWWCERTRVWRVSIPCERIAEIEIRVDDTGYDSDEDAEKFWSRVQTTLRMLRSNRSWLQPPITEAIVESAFNELELSALNPTANLDDFRTHTSIQRVHFSRNGHVLELYYQISEYVESDVNFRISFNVNDDLVQIEAGWD